VGTGREHSPRGVCRMHPDCTGVGPSMRWLAWLWVVGLLYLEWRDA
jgi:hypothetical protein